MIQEHEMYILEVEGEFRLIGHFNQTFQQLKMSIEPSRQILALILVYGDAISEREKTHSPTSKLLSQIFILPSALWDDISVS